MIEFGDFPDPRTADEDGLVAIGGDLSPERLLAAYRSGIFPWFQREGIVFWFCPIQRLVLFPEEVKVSRSMKQMLSSKRFTVTENRAFREVITGCAAHHEATKQSTWIDPMFIRAYCEMHRLGYARSIEVWEGEKLVGGLYGITTGQLFSGESMFSRVSNASKVALIHLCREGGYKLIDCQVPTHHLQSMGARVVHRDHFLKLVRQYGN